MAQLGHHPHYSPSSTSRYGGLVRTPPLPGYGLYVFSVFFVMETEGYGTFFSGRVPQVGGGAWAIIQIYFTHPLHHGSNKLHTAPPTLSLRPTRPPGLNHILYNILDRWGFGPPQDLRAVQLINYDLMLLM